MKKLMLALTLASALPTFAQDGDRASLPNRIRSAETSIADHETRIDAVESSSAIAGEAEYAAAASAATGHATLGAEIGTNSSFATDLTGWSGANWAWAAGGKALHTAGSTAALTQNVTLVNGTYYQIQWVMSGGTAGTVTFSVGAQTIRANVPVSIGSEMVVLASTQSGSVAFSATPTTDFDGNLDSFTIKPYATEKSVIFELKDFSGTSFAQFRGAKDFPGPTTNLYIGADAGRFVTGDGEQIAIGQTALRNAGGDGIGTGGYRNTAIGAYALRDNTMGLENTAVGRAAMAGSTMGSRNVSIGMGSMGSARTINDSVAVGYNAFLSANYSSQPAGVAIGNSALRQQTSGNRNVALGNGAGFTGSSVTTSTLMTFVGQDASLGSSTQRTNSFAFGANARVDCDNCGVIGDSGVTQIYFGSQASMAARLNVAGVSVGAGTAAIPAINFTADADGSGTGFYRTGANSIGVANNGVLTYALGTSSFQLLNSASLILQGDTSKLYFGTSNDTYLQRSGTAGTIALTNSSAVAGSFLTGSVFGLTAGLTLGPQQGSTLAFQNGNTGGNVFAQADTGGWVLAGTVPLKWTLTSQANTGSYDLGLARNAAGQMRVTDGSTGYGRILVADGTPGTNCAVGFQNGMCITATASPILDIGTVATGAIVISTTANVIPSNSQFKWSSGTIRANGPDTGLGRAAAGFVKFTDGSTLGGSLAMASDKVINWSSTTDPAGAADAGIIRWQAGRLAVSDGGASFGSFRATSFYVGNGAVLWCTGGGCSAQDVQISRIAGANQLAVTATDNVTPEPIKFALEVTANTGTATPAKIDSTKLFTNTGDGDGSSVTLPNDPTIGTCFEGAVTVAQNFDFTPSSGESIRDGASTGTTRIRSNTVGDTIRLCAVTGGSGAEWRVMSKIGTWTVS